MTDEQIKQNAEEYILPLKGLPGADENITFIAAIREAHIAGAHSCNEEIKELQTELESLRKGFYERGDKLKMLMLENNKLRNPWISVEDRLPEESKKYKGWLSDTVFVVTNKDDGTSARYDHATKTWCPAKILQGSITHWMPIPQIEKGE